MLAGLVVDWTCVSVSWWSAFVIRGWHGYVSCSPHCGIYIQMIPYTDIPKAFHVLFTGRNTGNHGTIKPSLKWNRCRVLSTVSPTVESHRPAPPRRENIYGCNLPARPVDKTCPYRPVLPLPSLLPVKISSTIPPSLQPVKYVGRRQAWRAAV